MARQQVSTLHCTNSCPLENLNTTKVSLVRLHTITIVYYKIMFSACIDPETVSNKATTTDLSPV